MKIARAIHSSRDIFSKSTNHIPGMLARHYPQVPLARMVLHHPSTRVPSSTLKKHSVQFFFDLQSKTMVLLLKIYGAGLFFNATASRFGNKDNGLNVA